MSRSPSSKPHVHDDDVARRHGRDADGRSRPHNGQPGDANGRSADGSGHGRHSRGSAEQRPPERIGHITIQEFGDADTSTLEGRTEEEMGSEEFDPATVLDEEPELTPEEIRRETERWAPRHVIDTAEPPTTVEKVCRVCGKNLKGHRRYKDEQGYICLDCDAEDRLRRLPCAECGKPTLPEALRPWGPVSICVRCWADHQNDPKQRIKRTVSSRPWEEIERRSVMMIAAVAGVLFCILMIASC